MCAARSLYIPLRLTLAMARAPPPAPAAAPDETFQYSAFSTDVSDPAVAAGLVKSYCDAATWAPLTALKADPAATVDQLADALTAAMTGAAGSAGLRSRTLTSDPPAWRSPPRKTNSNYKCWHDHECKRLQQA